MSVPGVIAGNYGQKSSVLGSDGIFVIVSRSSSFASSRLDLTALGTLFQFEFTFEPTKLLNFQHSNSDMHDLFWLDIYGMFFILKIQTILLAHEGCT